MASGKLVGYSGLIGALMPYVNRIGGYDEQIGNDADFLGDDMGDDLGDDMGDDLGDDLGARRRRHFKRLAVQQRRIAAMNARPSASGGIRVEANRRYDLGLGSVSVPAGGVAILVAAPAIRFRVDRIMLVPTAPGLLVIDIKSGIVSQTVGGSGSPVESFEPRAIGAQMSGQTLDPAIPVQVTFSNPTGAAISVAGNIFGLADQ